MARMSAPAVTTDHFLLDRLDEIWNLYGDDKKGKGTAFEQLIASYLRTAPEYADRFAEVYLWQDWPERDGKSDHGIDIVAKDIHTGGWCDAVVDGHKDKADAEWKRIVDGVRLAQAAGLEVHAGHGLDYETAETISALPEIRELNIGYFMMGEALFVGIAGTVREMRAAMDRGRAKAQGVAGA